MKKGYNIYTLNRQPLEMKLVLQKAGRPWPPTWPWSPKRVRKSTIGNNFLIIKSKQTCFKSSFSFPASVDDSANLASGISLDDLLTGVDRTKYYRYQGSLTTPNCNEAVVWTVFKDSIKISQDLVSVPHISKSHLIHILHVYVTKYTFICIFIKTF